MGRWMRGSVEEEMIEEGRRKVASGLSLFTFCGVQVCHSRQAPPTVNGECGECGRCGSWNGPAWPRLLNKQKYNITLWYAYPR